jgi:hypothetical protein
MITAKQAKQLYDESGQEIDDFLNSQVNIEVIKAAKEGNRSVLIHLGCFGCLDSLDQTITPLQRGAKAKLNELGYIVAINSYGDYYVPPGLADDEGNGPKHRNYGMVISW